jgi:hypothetical protein
VDMVEKVMEVAANVMEVAAKVTEVDAKVMELATKLLEVAAKIRFDITNLRTKASRDTDHSCVNFRWVLGIIPAKPPAREGLR